MKALKLKPSVKINGKHFDEEIRAIIDAVRKTAPDLSDDTVWVTSANDSTHKQKSKHYTNEAFDFRVSNVLGGDADIEQWARDIKAILGSDYDVIVEHNPPHLHVERDPKNGGSK